MPALRAFLNQAGYPALFSLLGTRIPQGDNWQNTVCIPSVVTSLSGALLLVQLLVYAYKSRRDGSKGKGPSQARQDDSCSNFQRYTKDHGGLVILSFRVLRFLGCLALFSLSLASIILKGKQQHFEWDRKYLVENGPDIAMLVTYWYTGFLAFISLAPNGWKKSVTRHNNVVLLSTWMVYAYRDIWPLGTYTDQPVDASDALFWVKFGILTLTAVIIPICIPRQYVPVDPKNPMPAPNPEQTASIASLLVYTFMDAIILEAASVPHLSHERLPPLCDYDYAQHLTEKNFRHLDPFQGAKKRHLFFNLMRVFRIEYMVMALSLTIQTIANFASPLAINRLLAFLESDGQGFYVRPWVWVFCLFAGPMVSSICFQWYIFIGTRTLARIEGLIIELVFEHSLRIRLKAETDSRSVAPSRALTPADTPDNGSIEEDSTVADSASQAHSSETTASTAKGKSKADPPTPATAPKDKKKDNLVGKINTLVTVDMDNITGSKDFLMVVLQVPLELVLSLTFLYAVLGWSAFVGLASIVVLLPVPGYLASKMQTIQKKKMEMTDARVESVTETVGVLRMIKLFGWERRTSKGLQDKRNEELKWVWKDKTTQLSLDVVNFSIPIITMVFTYATYTLIMKQSLSASKVFSSMSVFIVLEGLLHRISWSINQMLKGKVSLDRVGNFLKDTELLDVFDEETKAQSSAFEPLEHDDEIAFNNASFAWSKEIDDGTQTPSSRTFRLRVDGNLTFKRNCVNLVVGPTGSGKTSLLMALLGEMHFLPTNPDSWYNLPRKGGVAYAAQESWVQNETIRDNILFGLPFDEERYNKVIRQCSLERDLELFEAGDKTEVGEKGLTLSGGQKARVTLARAIYSSAEIILLDDILAALDVHTSKWIVDKCLKGDLVAGRTIILVTHNIALTRPIAGFIVSVGLDGYARDFGTDLAAAITQDPDLAREFEQEKDEIELEEEVVDEVKETKKTDGKLIMAEEIQQGRVGWKALKLFLVSLGGDRPIMFFIVWTWGLVFMHLANTAAMWFLGYWGSQYENHNPEDIDVFHYLSRYTGILVTCVISYTMATALYYRATIRASRAINKLLIESVLTAPLRWLDETPAGRIIARCTQDIASIDSRLPWGFGALIELALCMVVKLAGPVLFSPIFIFPGIFITVLGMYLGNIYLKAQMSVKREMSNAKAPVLSHFGAAIAGLVSIRAYGAQQPFKRESLGRIDHYIKISRTSYNLNRWIGVRIDVLGASFTAALASYLLIRRNLSAANAGFSLSMSIEFCSMILWLVRCYNDFEVQSNSLERIQAYLDIEHEPEPTQAGQPPAAWPKSGDLQVERLSARYSSGGPEVLHDLSFSVKSGERVGIVGRTGSGKSSLTLSLLRCILTEGVVYYDGVPTSKVNLDSLRSSITIIPQMPELLSGTLRRNLDPFEQNDDATLNDALRASGLFSLQSEADEARLTLDSDIASGGGNLSVGQRQIIALARAIVRNSKLLILDEATSAIDHKTDSIIQSTLRNELGSDVTILTVAHRLQTIMDSDKIMVLDAGRIVEFDTPQALLQKKGGSFKAMVDGSGDKRSLYQMAESRASGSTLV